MDKQLLASVAAVAVAAAGMGVGTFAFFSSSTSSDDNTFTAATLVLGQTTTIDGVQAGNMWPGNDAGLTLDLTNSGTDEVGSGGLYLKIEYSVAAPGGNDAALAGYLNIDAGDGNTFDAVDVSGDCGSTTVAALDGTSCIVYWGDANVDHVYKLHFTFTDNNLDQNDAQGGSVAISLSLTLAQCTAFGVCV